MTRPYRFLRAAETGDVVIDGASPIVPGVYFETARLAPGESRAVATEGREVCVTVLLGRVDVKAGNESFSEVGGRADMWSGRPDSVYAGSGHDVTVTCRDAEAEIAIAGGPSIAGLAPFRVTPEEVEEVDVGSEETHSFRKLCHILGKNQDGRVDRLIVSERYTTGGCWAGYPPHKHGTAGPEESAHDEVYHYRYDPSNGFGVQLWFDDAGASEVFMARSGDTFLFSDGYHPTLASPGHTEYCFTILYGRDQRSLVQNFQPEYRYMMDRFPGIANMIDRYK